MTVEVAATKYQVIAIPGDGVGPEVIAAARRVVDAAGARFGFDVEWSEILAGGIAIDAYGVAMRPADVELCRAADAVLLGAVGGPKWSDPSAAVRPEQALFALRGGLGLFANLRPVTVHPALVPSSPLRPELLEGVDLLIVRELTGGIYFGKPSEERRRFPTVEVNHQLVDSCAMLLVRHPADFDVIVTENLFGDILSDEAAVLAGSLGMLPSASLGDRLTKHGTFGLYEPIHGSAPDIAGEDKANPIGTILSAAMMLRLSLGLDEAATAVETAVTDALDGGWRTGDLADPADPDDGLVVVGTTGFATAVIESLQAAVPA